MRYIHTADWHLGRLFHGLHLTDDQDYLLKQFVDLAREARPDAVLVAGDVYDRAVPPPEAVEVLDEVLARLVGDLGIPVVMIAGNHDSPNRINFCSRLLARQGLHVVGMLEAVAEPIVLQDTHGPVAIHALPYAEPSMVRACVGLDGIGTHDDAMRACVARVLENHPKEMRSVLVAHAFVAGGAEAESERPLSVGGAGTVDAGCFDPFDYVALGHLHRPQAAGRDVVRYSGSLMKYSFSEVDDRKSVYLVEMDQDGACRMESVSLTPRRDLRHIKGYLKDLLEHPDTTANREDYLLVTLLDDGALLDAMGRLREIYPNVLHVERPALETTGEWRGAHADRRRMDVTELFDAFFEQVTGHALNNEQRSAFAHIIGRMEQNAREAVS